MSPKMATRRVVRRRTLDAAWDRVLADFPPELHPHLRRYAEARGELTMAEIPHKIEWWKIDKALAGL
jgi:hypothetical protein